MKENEILKQLQAANERIAVLEQKIDRLINGLLPPPHYTYGTDAYVEEEED